MEQLAYPFDSAFILKKRKSIKRELLAQLEQAEQEAAHAAKALEDDKKLALASVKSEADAKLAEKDAKLAALEF